MKLNLLQATRELKLFMSREVILNGLQKMPEEYKARQLTLDEWLEIFNKIWDKQFED